MVPVPELLLKPETEVINVPVRIPGQLITSPTFRLPWDKSVTVSVVPEIEPVNRAIGSGMLVRSAAGMLLKIWLMELLRVPMPVDNTPVPSLF